MIECVPPPSVDVVNVAFPLDNVFEPKVAVPFLNVTVPVGVPTPELTVAVNVTACPNVDGFNDEVTFVEVGAGLTVWVIAPEDARYRVPPL